VFFVTVSGRLSRLSWLWLLLVHRSIVRFHLWIAAALAAIVTATGLIWSTRVAAGADAYGYVSQADLWLRGDLHIDQSFGASVPWPLARWTFTPLGYRPEPDGYRIVPQYSPGLPLLMAGFKAIAGQCAIFWVVPICGGVLVSATYAIGRRLGRPIVGLAAGWLVATSPTVLFMLMAPMSDVPAAAAWALSVACALGQAPAAALSAGAAAGGAILIRPNLAPLAGAIFFWLLWRGRVRRGPATGQPALWFLAPAAAGAAAVGLINARLYGSPLASGYDLTDGFLLSYVWPNVQRYSGWLISAETPFAVMGLSGLAVSSAPLWRTQASRDARWILGAVAAMVWVSYLLFVPWDAWWYLRFLLPAWPAMMISAASLAAALYRGLSFSRRAAAILLLAAIGIHGVWQAAQRQAFAVAFGESRYVEVAKTVESLTDPDAVIIAAQHSGSIRYYAGRLTLRWDVGDPAWLDRTVDWLTAHGHHPYFVLEPPEIEQLRARPGPANLSARLDWTPMVSFRGGAVTMYDGASRTRDGTAVAQLPARASHDCPGQRPAPRLRDIQ
jgi:hypothetical protein